MSSLPLSVMVRSCHPCVNLSHLRSRLLSHQRWALAGSTLLTMGWVGAPEDTLFVKYLSFKIYGIWPKQASKQTYTRVQCSPASMGVAQARPNYLFTNLKMQVVELYDVLHYICITNYFTAYCLTTVHHEVQVCFASFPYAVAFINHIHHARRYIRIANRLP